VLIEATEAKRAGQQYGRWAALTSLERLANDALPDVLTSLLRDRATLVRNTAVSMAIAHGDGRLIPHLQRIASADRAAPGVRAEALRAIEAIKLREGLAETPPTGR
jgi:HEAT repeat protein